MPDPTGPVSRRAVARGLAAITVWSAPPARLRAAPDDGPPVLTTAHHQFTELDPARIMPALPIATLDGAPVPLRPPPGRVMLVHVWATWCPACRTDLQALDRFHTGEARVDMKTRVAVAAIAIDQAGRAAVAPFVRSLGLKTLPIYLDPDGQDARQAEGGGAPNVPFPLYGMPSSFVIASSGRIEGYILGAIDWSEAPARTLLAYFARR